MREYILLVIVVVVLYSFFRYLLKYPEDFSNYYYRIKYYKNKPEEDI